MRWIAFVLFLGIFTQACKKTGIVTDPGALVFASADTLSFDTVFTSVGSVTKSFKIFNPNDEKIVLSEVKLLGMDNYFKINVDGSPGNATNVEIEPNDSIYVFVAVNINPSVSTLPFVVQDSISIKYNGNEKQIQLQAYGRNARFLNKRDVTTDSVWTSDLPIVILGGIKVRENVQLKINAGTEVYCHADAPVVVNGQLVANGTAANKIVFTGDRLDEPYKYFPASWPGITFGESSSGNLLQHVVIKNAYQAVVANPQLIPVPKVVLDACVIDNAYDAGIVAVASSVSARNCLITNCGANIYLAGGGSYSFDYCTVVTYTNLYFDHKRPVLFVTNSYDGFLFDLDAKFRNSIFYGEGGLVEDEIVVEKKGSTAFNLSFENILYKSKNPLAYADAASLRNLNPAFDTVNVSKLIYNFRLRDGSPCVDAAKPLAGVPFDLDGLTREVPAGKPDIGCYERQ